MRRGLVMFALISAAIAMWPAGHAHAQDVTGDRAMAFLGLARVRRDTGDMAAARRYFEDAARLRPLSVTERTEYFWILQAVDADAALATGKTVLRGAPADHDVRDRTIGLAMDLKREDVVVALAEEGVRVQSNSARWHRRLAESYLRQGRPEEAAEAFARAIAHPDRMDTDRALRAVALDAAGRLAESAEAWTHVPASVRDSRPDWQRSNLRALASTVPSEETATILEAWLAAYPDDAEMRALAGTVWLEAGYPGRAVAVIQTAGDLTSLRKAIHIARNAGLHGEAIALTTRVVQSRAATPADRRSLVEMLIDSREYARAIAVFDAAAPAARCETSFLALIDRIAGPRGTQALFRAMTDPKCATQPRWLARAIERAVAESSFESALQLIECLPASESSRPGMLALAGQLQLWSGQAEAAVPLLESALRARPDDESAREALVDALRALGRSRDAWTVSAPLRAMNSLAPTLLLTLGELAIEIGNPESALDLMRGVPPSPATDSARAGVIDRAERLLSDRRRNEALSRLHAIAKSGRIADTAETTRLMAAIPPADVPVEVWFLLVDHSAAAGHAPLEATLNLLSSSLPAASSLLIDVANRLSAFVKTGGDVFVTTAIHWIDRINSGDDSRAVPLRVARARILAVHGKWAESLAAIDEVLQRDRNHAPALKLRADVLSWSGEHTLAIQAYEAYCRREPDDIEARRQQARVAGWAGRTDLALPLYEALVTRFPASPVISAEHDAKSAFLTGRWLAATEAYARWIALEPDNGEALFEYAQALRAAGQPADADTALSELAATSLHAMASDAWRRVQRSRRPAAALLFDSRAAAGYGGQRLLERRTEEGGFMATLGAASTTRFDFSAGRAMLRGADGARHGYHGLARVSSMLSPTIALDARAEIWDVWSDSRPATEGALQLRMRAADRWTVTAGFDHSLMFENLAVVDGRLAATGGTGTLRFDSTSAGFEAGTGWHHLSDGNARSRSFATYNRTISSRVRGLRAIVWAEALLFRDPSPLYYSPAAQIRIDVGAQYSHDFRVPRFRGDRINAVTGAYLIGTDRDGVIYHHPTVRVSLELAHGLAFEARADWIRSTVYNDRTITFGMSIGGSGGVRR